MKEKSSPQGSARRYIEKAANALELGADRTEEFINCFSSPPPGFQGIIWRVERPSDFPFKILPPLPWQAPFVDRLNREARPGAHQLHTDGAYYCLDFSSVFESTPLLTISSASFAIDVCASPGGKSVFTNQACAPQRMISNEVVKKRLGALHGNLTRCKVASEISSVEVGTLANKFAGQADLAVVDAPCSGQSLVLRGIDAPNCFHPVNVKKCAMRQRRIIAESAKLVSPGGSLAYMTCTFSVDENERVIDWFLKSNPEFESVEVPQLLEFESQLTENKCYRLWPWQSLGAGGFTALLRRSA